MIVKTCKCCGIIVIKNNMLINDAVKKEDGWYCGNCKDKETTDDSN